VRSIIAKRLLESKLTAPSLYVSTDVQLDQLSALRKTLAEQVGSLEELYVGITGQGSCTVCYLMFC
jgi:pyruvate/2-oxoglutarate dehydrogenase complex dihydrolipoamide acyltransferase (E2) component